MSESVDVLEELGQVTVPEQRESAEDSKYGNVVASYPDGTEVPGLLTVAEFTNELTIRNFDKGMRHDGIVRDASVYTAMTAKRHPIPVVLVGDKAFLPQEAFDAWENRPVRGEGTGGPASRRSDEDLLKVSANARESLAKTEKRIENLLGRRDKERKLVERYDRQLSERFGDNAWAKVDEWISANEATTATEENND